MMYVCLFRWDLYHSVLQWGLGLMRQAQNISLTFSVGSKCEEMFPLRLKAAS